MSSRWWLCAWIQCKGHFLLDLGMGMCWIYMHTCTLCKSHVHMCAHHLLAACYNEMEEGLCQRRDGVTLWLCLTGSDPDTSSRSSSQPTQPPPSPSPERRSQSMLEGGAGHSAPGSIHRQALSHAQPHHLSMTKYWHCRRLNSVCCFAEICEDGMQNTCCDKRIHNFIFVTQTTWKTMTSL